MEGHQAACCWHEGGAGGGGREGVQVGWAKYFHTGTWEKLQSEPAAPGSCSALTLENKCQCPPPPQSTPRRHSFQFPESCSQQILVMGKL